MFTPVLPFAFAGIVIGVGTLLTTEAIMGDLASPDSLFYQCWNVVLQGGWTVFNQLPLLFAVALPIGMAMYIVQEEKLIQSRFHPSCLQTEIRTFCAQHDIAVQGYSTLANGKVFQCPEIEQISRELGVSVAQLCTRYAMQHGVTPLVKSVNAERIRDNLKLDFTLDAQMMQRIDAITTCGGSYKDSDEIIF